MREMMGHELHCPTELPPQNRAGGVANLAEAPQEFRLHLGIRPPVRVKFRAANLRIERVRHPVDCGSLKSRMIQTKAYRLLGKIVRVVTRACLACLTRLNRSSSHAATTFPSTSKAAADS
jgi:hypothetical protein